VTNGNKGEYGACRVRQNSAFPRAYRSQTDENRPLNSRGLLRSVQNLIRVPMRPGAHAAVTARAALW
jgi:hypothetical protein